MLAKLRLLGLLAAMLAGFRLDTPPVVAETSVVFFAEAEGSVDFAYRNGMSGELYFVEIMGGGGAWIDFDNDGDLDLFLVQGHPLGATSPPNKAPHDRLFRNDLPAEGLTGSEVPRFTDVTAESGLAEATGYGMGVAVGDFDNDGWSDLYITNFGANQLWRNNGPNADGVVTFSDVTAETGTDDPRWSTSAAFVDFDHDGWLDLYLVNYVDFTLDNHKQCINEAGARDYCGPRSYQSVSDRMWRNEGPDEAGVVRFTDISAEVGLLDTQGPGLGVVTADFDGNGFVDIYVANDQALNHLWLNLGDGDFREAGLESGSAMDSRGRVQASMGVDTGDVDGDGDPDLFMTHLLQEFNTLYLNDGGGLFADRTSSTGMGPPSIGHTGFGTALFDVENDGDLDVVVANGGVRIDTVQQAAGDPFPLRQPNQLFLNEDHAGPRFIEASDHVPSFEEPRVSRAAIIGDVDNDGDSDFLVTNIEDSVQLYLNQEGSNVWVGFRVQGVGGRNMLGAQVTLEAEGLEPMRRQVRTDGGYLTSRDPRVIFGLGNDDWDRVVLQVQVRWPGGHCENWDVARVRRYQTLIEGEGDSC